MKNRFLSALLFLAVYVASAMAVPTVPVSGTLVDGQGRPVINGQLVFQLMGCTSPNVPVLASNPSRLVSFTTTIKAGTNGALNGSVIPNNAILCGGTTSTYYHVTPYNGSTKLDGEANFLVSSSFSYGTAQAMGFTPEETVPSVIISNPTGSQTITTPGGFNLNLVGSTIFSGGVTINSLQPALLSGAFTTGHCISVDGAGHFIDSGSACSTLGTNIALTNADNNFSVGQTITGSLTASSVITPSLTLNSKVLTLFQGNGTKIQLSTGSATTGKCVEYDANGNTVVAASNAPCGTAATSFQANGVSLTSTSTINYQDGNNITVTNPSAGNVAIALTGTILAARMPALTGDVTSSVGTVATTLTSVVTAGTNTKITYDVKGRVTAGAQAAFTDLSGSVAAGQMPALTGDVTSSAGSTATTLASIVTTGTNTKITYDAKGRVTAGAQAQFSDIGGSATIGQLPVTVAVTNSNNNFSTSQTVTGTVTATTFSGSGASLTSLPAGNLTGTVPAAQMPALTGDITSSAGSTTTTLASTVTAGTNTKITYDVKGRVTAGAQAQFTDIGGSVAAGQLPAFTGDATATAGTAALTVVKVNGVSYAASPGLHTIQVITASGVATAKTIPDCPDTAGNHLNFTQSGDSITCGNTGGGGGSSLLASLQIGTNPTMTTVGTYLQLAMGNGMTASWSGSGTVGSPYISTLAVSDASNVVKGILALSGDFGGTAASPLVSKIQGITVTVSGSNLTFSGNIIANAFSTATNTPVQIPSATCGGSVAATVTLCSDTGDILKFASGGSSQYHQVQDMPYLTATASLTAGQTVKLDTTADNSVVVATTTDTTSGIVIGFVNNSPGAGGGAIVQTSGVITTPLLGTGTCTRGQFVIQDTTTNGRVQCTSTYPTAGRILGHAVANQAAVGSAVAVLIELK